MDQVLELAKLRADKKAEIDKLNQELVKANTDLEQLNSELLNAVKQGNTDVDAPLAAVSTKQRAVGTRQRATRKPRSSGTLKEVVVSVLKRINRGDMKQIVAEITRMINNGEWNSRAKEISNVVYQTVHALKGDGVVVVVGNENNRNVYALKNEEE